MTTDADTWLAANTFICEKLAARLRADQCQANRRAALSAEYPGRNRVCIRCEGPPSVQELTVVKAGAGNKGDRLSEFLTVPAGDFSNVDYSLHPGFYLDFSGYEDLLEEFSAGAKTAGMTPAESALDLVYLFVAGELRLKGGRK